MIDYQIQSIKGKKVFEFVFSSALKFYNKDAAIFVCFKSGDIQHTPEENLPFVISFAPAVPKRSAKKAVIRNRIKRLLRVAIKEIVLEYAKNDVAINIEYLVVVWYSAPSHPGLIGLDSCREVTRTLIQRALDYKARKDKKKN